MKEYQVYLDWSCWWIFKFKRVRHEESDMAYIYDWILRLGPIEVRKWAS